MQNKKRWILWIVSLTIVVFIRLFSASSFRSETWYATGIYPNIAIFLRSLTGWLPFSLGDLLYGAAGAWLLYKLVRAIKAIVKKEVTVQVTLKKFSNAILILLLIYIVFNIFWGINYNRRGIASQLGLTVAKYSTEDLRDLNTALLQKINESKTATLRSGTTVLTSKTVFEGAAQAYGEVYKKYPFLQYRAKNIKISLWGWFGNYAGFTGYYNPFTAEAQVNTTVPKFLQPYIACHEIGHQLGYAKENEANFVGYLSATASKDSAFLYSAYLDLFLYAGRNLYNVDSATAKSLAHQLLPGVKADLKELSNFNRRHQNPFEPVLRWMYGKYLQSNQQPSGVLSYDEVTGLLIAYYKKYGTL
ncbi:MAG: hypothetical protein JWR61_5694 [Ferruginibacter sp.]|uniref:DUF3810 domain-containing protein n=1 Tax=Ferruginibacter sp. TaxID=1940288 RepID=UPI002657EABF|nr:DUF3810 domain-containing protein [Ferruginibacter sp.]MDB5280739.1 hypothetical protein [Ferruginibacter sp.]